MRLDGKVVIVTGGCGGIGKAVCNDMLQQGAQLVLADIDLDSVNQVINEYSDAYPDSGVTGIQADVRDEESIESLVRQALKKFGQVDLLVHCAGILRASSGAPKFLHQTDVEDWDTVIDINLKGTFITNKAVIPAMIKQGGGQIINISSTSGLKGRAFDSAYCASKFGMIGLSESLAEEVRGHGIRVHVIMPDAVDTPIWQQNGPIQAPEDALPPERIANVISYLAGLPEDVILNNLVIRPFRARRRRKKKMGK